MTVEELNRRVWGYSNEADNTMLKNVIYRLRRKIETDPANPQIIRNVSWRRDTSSFTNNPINLSEE